ncbi:MAG: hypothetical protein R3F02_03980 [Thiolinea sp.]
MKIISSSIAIALLVALSGCSTLTKEGLQPVSVSSKSTDGQPVNGAHCMMQNDKGSGEITTPTTVKLKRSDQDLIVNCTKPGYPDGKLRAISRASSSLYGNAIFGGVIGAAIDHSSGKAYDYPNRLEVTMGDSIIVDRRDRAKN